MKWDIVRLCGLDMSDVSGMIHLEMDRGYVDPVSWVQAVLEDIVEFLEDMLSEVSTFPVCFAEFFFSRNFRLFVND